ncbi:MAG TPA: competence/damage-inducible protein A [Bryobacteraceae bacterium]|jgi:nicotinamide-nucleotide amidase|nr:competence/damage-inducible protein A [Bryobacteraceae bacterium]
MNAEIIAVGSEMLTAGRLDTNSLFITEHLNALGIEVTAKHVIGDDTLRLVTAIQRALADSTILFLSGGLGPTEDDLTRDAVARAIGCTMAVDPGILSAIEQRFLRMSRKMPEINRRQAMILDGAEILSNDRGTAPGQWRVVSGGSNGSAQRFVVLLPGPPSELKSMFTRECLPRLERIAPKAAIHTAVLRVTGLSESQLDQTIAPLYVGVPHLETTVLAHEGDLQVRFRAQCQTREEAAELSERIAAQAVELLGPNVYSRDGGTLEMVVGARLTAAGATVTVAESATGGGLAQRITSVPGSSAYFAGGYITYARSMKTQLLGVPADLLAQHGAVSQETAAAMADGARRAAHADWAVSITGNAGPSTDGEEAPVGTVFIGIAGPDKTEVTHRLWPVNDRGRVRAFASQAALDLLNRRLIAHYGA